MTPPAVAPKLQGLLETALYTADLELARRFYEDILGLQPMVADARLVAYAVAPAQVLLLFQAGATTRRCNCRVARFPDMTAVAVCTSPSPSPPKTCRLGKRTCRRARSPLRDARPGRRAGTACTSATRTSTW